MKIKKLILKTCLIMAAIVSQAAPVDAEDKINFTNQYATIDGLKIHYKTGGNGPYLFLLHGFTLTGEQWLPFAEELARDYTLIIADLPGHGGSEMIKGLYSSERAADIMLNLLKQLNIHQVKGMGHSAGGITLMHMAVKDPNVFESMILISSGHRSSEDGRKLLMEEKFEDLNDELKEFYFSIHPGGLEQIKKIFEAENQLAGQFSTTAEDAALSPDILDDIKTPSLIIWGDRDTYFPIDVAVELYQSLPNARLWVIPGQGHVPLWPEWGGDKYAFSQFTSIVKEFLDSPLRSVEDKLTDTK